MYLAHPLYFILNTAKRSLNVSHIRIYLERQKCYGPDKKILFKKPLFDLEVKGQGPKKVITVCDTPPDGHAPTYQI